MRRFEASECSRAVALVAATVAIAGCGESTPQQDVSVTESGSPENTFTRSLDEYRENTKKGVANIALGICVAWPNQGEGMTVVLNPGLVEYSRGVAGMDSFVTFLAGSTDAPETIVMDGPSLFEPQMLIYGDPPDRFTGGPTKVRISKPMQHESGSFYYKDTDTGEKVMYTALINGPVTLRNVRAECEEMSGKETEALAETQPA